MITHLNFQTVMKIILVMAIAMMHWTFQNVILMLVIVVCLIRLQTFALNVNVLMKTIMWHPCHIGKQPQWNQWVNIFLVLFDFEYILTNQPIFSMLPQQIWCSNLIPTQPCWWWYMWWLFQHQGMQLWWRRLLLWHQRCLVWQVFLQKSKYPLPIDHYAKTP